MTDKTRRWLGRMDGIFWFLVCASGSLLALTGQWRLALILVLGLWLFIAALNLICRVVLQVLGLTTSVQRALWSSQRRRRWEERNGEDWTLSRGIQRLSELGGHWANGSFHGHRWLWVKACDQETTTAPPNGTVTCPDCDLWLEEILDPASSAGEPCPGGQKDDS